MHWVNVDFTGPYRLQVGSGSCEPLLDHWSIDWMVWDQWHTKTQYCHSCARISWQVFANILGIYIRLDNISEYRTVFKVSNNHGLTKKLRSMMAAYTSQSKIHTPVHGWYDAKSTFELGGWAGDKWAQAMGAISFCGSISFAVYNIVHLRP